MMGRFPVVCTYIFVGILAADEYPPYVPADEGEALNEEQCATVATRWVEKQEKSLQAAFSDEAQLLDLAIFLHVPRTAGRVVHRCVLKAGFKDRCVKSYDALRVNFSDSTAMNCGLFTSHQDHRIIDQAHEQGRPWVLTMLRDPVDRVLSSYEFAIEVTARRLGLPIICDLNKVCTRHVWPWTYLIPHSDRYMNTSTRVEIMRARRTARRDQSSYDYYNTGKTNEGNFSQGTCAAEDATVCKAMQEAGELDAAKDPYACSMMQPLEEFLLMEMSQDLLDNAAAFQLLGISELTPVLNDGSTSGGTLGGDKPLKVSTSPKVAAQLRRCTRKHGPQSNVSTVLLAHALHRLENHIDVLMLHERLDDSVSTAASLLAVRNPSAGQILGPVFQKCVSNQTSKMSARKTKGMTNLLWPDGEQLWFGRETRQQLSAERLQRIRDRNWMDDSLHKRATELFDERFRKLERSGILRKVKRSVVRDM